MRDAAQNVTKKSQLAPPWHMYYLYYSFDYARELCDSDGVNSFISRITSESNFVIIQVLWNLYWKNYSGKT